MPGRTAGSIDVHSGLFPHQEHDVMTTKDSHQLRSPRRVLVIGTSGLGKSTLAARIAERLSIPFVATDEMYWTSNWQLVDEKIVERRIAAVVQDSAWVLDGNFDRERAIVWPAADLIVWLDLPLATTVRRVAVRNLGWWLSRSPIWGGKRVTLARALSGIRHSARSHAGKRRTYPDALAAQGADRVVMLRSAAMVEAWLAGVKRDAR
nr:AAA family ATPase [Sphingomonas hankookensis]